MSLDEKAAAQSKKRAREEVVVESKGFDLDSHRRQGDRYSEECWGCRREFNGAARSSPAADKLWRWIGENAGNMSEETLYQKVAELFITYVARPLLESKKEVPRWSAHMIKLHLTRHSVNPFFGAVRDAYRAQTILDEASSRCFSVDAKGTMEMDIKMAEIHLKLLKAKQDAFDRVHRMRPTT